MARGRACTRRPTTTNWSTTPVELGRFWRGHFEAAGTPHEFVVAGALPDFDGERLLADTRRICEAQIAFWHENTAQKRQGQARAAPGQARHRSTATCFCSTPPKTATADSSTAPAPHCWPRGAICQRDRAGRPGRPPAPARRTATACRNQRRLREPARSHQPRVLPHLEREASAARRTSRSYDYTRENYTELLWFFGGASRPTTTTSSCCEADSSTSPATCACWARRSRAFRPRRAARCRGVAPVQLRCLGEVLPGRREHTECPR